MAGSNNPADGNVRLWAVRRKEGPRRPFPGSPTAHTRPTHNHGAAVRHAYRPSRTGRELDLVVRHFDDQRLHPDEVGTLSAAILEVVNRGGTRVLGPVGRQRRRYEICRLADVISVRSGEGRVRLSLTSAVRLAGLLGASRGAGMARTCA